MTYLFGLGWKMPSIFGEMCLEKRVLFAYNFIQDNFVLPFAYSTLAYLNDMPIRFRLKNAFYLWRKGSYLFAYNLIVQANFMLLFCLFNVGLNDVHIQLRLNNVFYSHVLFDDDRPCTAIIQIFTVKCFNYEMLNVESLSILAEDLV